MTSPADVDEVSDELTGEQWDDYRSQYVDTDHANLIPSEVDTYIQTEAFSVLEGAIPSDGIESSLRGEDDLSRESEHAGYELYASDDRAYAVGDDTFLGTTFGNDPASALRQIIDASEGDVDRYTDVNEDAPDLFDELPDGHAAFGSVYDRGEGSFEDNVASGVSMDIDGEETDQTVVYVFVGDIDDGTERDLEDHIDESSDFDDYREGPDLDISGNVATIEGTLRTTDIDL